MNTALKLTTRSTFHGRGLVLVVTLIGIAIAAVLGYRLLGSESPPVEDTATISTADIPRIGPAADFELTNQHGQRVRLADLRGSAVLIDFFFADCDDFCPSMNLNFKQIHDRLSRPAREGLVMLSITFDPETDTPAHLLEYADSNGFDIPNWHFLTGTLLQVAEVTRNYGIATAPIEEFDHNHDDGSVHHHDRDISHMAQALLIDPEGHVRRAYLGAPAPFEIFSPELLAAEIEFIISEAG